MNTKVGKSFFFDGWKKFADNFPTPQKNPSFTPPLYSVVIFSQRGSFDIKLQISSFALLTEK